MNQRQVHLPVNPSSIGPPFHSEDNATKRIYITQNLIDTDPHVGRNESSFHYSQDISESMPKAAAAAAASSKCCRVARVLGFPLEAGFLMQARCNPSPQRLLGPTAWKCQCPSALGIPTPQIHTSPCALLCVQLTVTLNCNMKQSYEFFLELEL